MVVKESISRDILRLFVWYPLRWLIISLPVGLGISVLGLMGEVHFRLSKGKKAHLGKNLSFMFGNALGEERKTGIIRQYMRNHYIDRLLIFIFPKLDKKSVGKHLEFSGLENLDKALKLNKGVILVHGHFGPVHIPLVAFARLGYGMKQIGLPSDEGLSWIGKNVAFRLRMKYESMIPAEIIKADSFLKGAFKWLGNNGIIMITGDGSGTERRLGKHEEFEFFGQKMLFPLGPSLLSEKTGAALLPLFITPGEKKRYKIVIEPPLRPALDSADTAKDTTGQFVKRFEGYVARYPGYMHFLDKFHPGGLISGDK